MINQSSVYNYINNYNIIEIYLNRISLTMHIFIVMDYLIMMSEKYRHFRKRQKHVPRNYFLPVEVTGFMFLRKYFLSYVLYLKDMCKNLKEIEISKLHGVWANEKFEIMKL